MIIENIRQLAFSYFEGKITREEEAILYNFISHSKENEKIFRDWEKSWMQSEEKNRLSSEEWYSLKRKIQTLQTQNVSTIRYNKRRSLYQKIAAVAAIAAIAIISLFTINQLSNETLDEKILVIETKYGEKKRVTLPDSSIVWLNCSSRISYSSEFGVLDRNIELSGEAYFEVMKQEGKLFKVKTNSYDVVVKGTKFNLASYPEERYTVTVLLDGKVQILDKDKVLDMSPGELVQMDALTKKMSKENVDVEQYKSWIDNKIEYNAIRFDELLNRLSRQYGVKIHYDFSPESIKILRISINNEEPLTEILNGLSKVVDVNVKYRDKDVYVSLND